MTENEAIEIITNAVQTENMTVEQDKALSVAQKVFEEIQQYREIGTVEELRELKESSFSGIELVKIAISVEELKEYKSIGTVKECREAVEKQKAKKPTYEGDGYADDELVYDIWICPNCGECYEIDYDDHSHCPNCGQAIDLSEVN